MDALSVVAPTQQLNQSRVISSQVQVADRQLEVESNFLSSPNVASVAPVVATDFDGAAWYADPTTGDLYAQARPESYSLTYREVDVKPEQLQAGIAGAPSGRGSLDVQASTTVDAAIAARVHELTDTVTAETTTPYAAAAAIQKWLRTDGGFSYDLQLPESVLDENGSQIRDPILRFLKSKTGYCVQFASTMVMMARSKGIPARMALGFLPARRRTASTPCGRPTRHAWPELYFPGAGWLRFEPTPSVRTGTAPIYTIPATAPVPGATTSAPTDPGATGSATSTARDPGAPEVDGATAAQAGSFGDQVQAWLREPLHLLLVASWACSAAWSCPLPRSSSTVDAVRRRRRPASWPRPSGTSWSRARRPRRAAAERWRHPAGVAAALRARGASSTRRPTRRWAPSSPRSSGRYARPGSAPVALTDEIHRPHGGRDEPPLATAGSGVLPASGRRPLVDGP